MAMHDFAHDQSRECMSPTITHGNQMTYQTISNAHLKYQPLLCHQSAVGWDQLLLGQFVLESRDLHSQYLKFKQEETKANLCQTWLLRIINILWKQVYLNQEAHNPNKHSGDQSTREAA